MIVLLLLACKPVETAPEDLDALLHYAWVQFDDGADEALAEAVVNLHVAIGGDTLADTVDGSVTRLTADEAAVVGVTDRDPAEAAGIYLTRDFACGWQPLLEILTFPAQDALYSGYDAYERTYHDSIDAFLAGDIDVLSWDLDYTASILGGTYHAHTNGRLRRVPDLGPDLTPHGPFVLARTFFPAPAEFEGSSNKSMDQDYQLELFWPRGDAEILHAYGMWRQANFGTGFTTEDDSVQRILLNNLADIDDDTADYCAEGLPE